MNALNGHMTKCGYEYGVESNYINYPHNLIHTRNLFTFACVCVCEIDMLPYKNICVQPFCSSEAHASGSILIKPMWPRALSSIRTCANFLTKKIP
jgi:hypothetical protein